MSGFSQILSLILAGIVIFLLYRMIKNQPQLFTKEKFSKTLTTMGALALALIVFVYFLILMVQH
jgi:uncharacterized membrane protein